MWENAFTLRPLSPSPMSVAALPSGCVTLSGIVSAKMATQAMLAPTQMLTISPSQPRSVPKSVVWLHQLVASLIDKF